MDILMTDVRLNVLKPFLVKDANGNEIGLARLVDTINASEVGRDYLNARQDWGFLVDEIVDPNAIVPAGQYEGGGVIRLFLKANTNLSHDGVVFNTDVLFSLIVHEGRHGISSLGIVPIDLQHLAHGEAIRQETAIWDFASANQAQILSDPQGLGAQLRASYGAARYLEEGRAELSQMEARM